MDTSPVIAAALPEADSPALAGCTEAVAGPALVPGMGGMVAASLGASYGIRRLLGPPWRMAVGTFIHGNPAIAPVIGTGSKDVAASVAFTASPPRYRWRCRCRT